MFIQLSFRVCATRQVVDTSRDRRAVTEYLNGLIDLFKLQAQRIVALHRNFYRLDEQCLIKPALNTIEQAQIIVTGVWVKYLLQPYDLLRRAEWPLLSIHPGAVMAYRLCRDGVVSHVWTPGVVKCGFRNPPSFCRLPPPAYRFRPASGQTQFALRYNASFSAG